MATKRKKAAPSISDSTGVDQLHGYCRALPVWERIWDPYEHFCGMFLLEPALIAGGGACVHCVHYIEKDEAVGK